MHTVPLSDALRQNRVTGVPSRTRTRESTLCLLLRSNLPFDSLSCRRSPAHRISICASLRFHRAVFGRIDDWLAYDVRDRHEEGLRRARNNGKKDVRIHAHPIDAERVVGRPVLTHTKHFSGHVVVKSNSLAVPSGGDTKQRLLEWMVRPGRPSSKLWYLSARWKRAALSLGSRPEFRILESHFTFASGSPPPSLSFSQSVLRRPVVSLTFVTITRIAEQLSMISREIRGFVRFLRN